jgi:hypothetical protein
MGLSGARLPRGNALISYGLALKLCQDRHIVTLPSHLGSSSLKRTQQNADELPGDHCRRAKRLSFILIVLSHSIAGRA